MTIQKNFRFEKFTQAQGILQVADSNALKGWSDAAYIGLEYCPNNSNVEESEEEVEQVPIFSILSSLFLCYSGMTCKNSTPNCHSSN
jgi:hypothetical protein